MKFVLILLVLSVYITTIRPFLVEDTLQRLFKIDQNTSSSISSVPFDKNVQIENKPYARSLKSVDNELKFDLDDPISAERIKDDSNANRRMNYFKTAPQALRRQSHRRDNVQVWNQLLDSLKIDTKLISRQKKQNDHSNIALPKKQTVINRNKTKKPMLKKKKSLRRVDDQEDSESVSSEWDYGMDYWRNQVQEERKLKHADALAVTTPRGDVVNMAAARPWGVPCGDPMQHDMPWGTCMLPMECEPELRIYRGDVACGRTQYVCCALQLNTYDMYAGVDASFADTDLELDADDAFHEGKDSNEKKKDKERREKKRRERERKARKRRMRKNIARIVKRIKMILSQMYKNTTDLRKLKTKNLKAYIKMLKKKYKQDRLEVKKLHEYQLKELDNELFERLDQILHMNKEFAHNETFREFLINGTLTPKAARMLSVMYPDLATKLRTYYARRSGANLKDGDSGYDVEYGYLYY